MQNCRVLFKEYSRYIWEDWTIKLYKWLVNNIVIVNIAFVGYHHGGFESRSITSSQSDSDYDWRKCTHRENITLSIVKKHPAFKSLYYND